MLLKSGLALLFFLPIVESYSRPLGLSLLLLGSLLISLGTFWQERTSFDFVELLWLMILVIFCVSLFTSLSFFRSFLEFLRYIAYFLIFVSLRHFEKSRRILLIFFIAMVLVNSFVLSIISLLYYFPQLRLPFPPDGMNFVYPTFGHNRISELFIFTMPAVIMLWSNAKKKKKQLGLGFLVIFFFLILILSQGRGAMLSLTLGFIFYFIFKQKYEKWIIFLSLITVFLLSTSFIYSNFLVKDYSGLRRPKGFYKPAVKENRLNYFVQAFKGFTLSPLTGTGLDTFRFISKQFRPQGSSWSWYTHNHYLQVFTETGLLGGIFFTLLILILLRRSFQNREYSDGLFIAVFSSSLHSLFDFDWQFLSVFLFLWMALAILAPVKSHKGKPFSPAGLSRLFFIIVNALFFTGIFITFTKRVG